MATAVPQSIYLTTIILLAIAIFLALVIIVLLVWSLFFNKKKATKGKEAKAVAFDDLTTGESKEEPEEESIEAAKPAAPKETSVVESRPTPVGKEAVVSNEPVATPVEEKADEDEGEGADAKSGFARLNYSFKARQIMAPKESQQRLSAIINYFLSFADVRKSDSWSRVSFTYKGKRVACLRIRGKTIRVYFALDPKTLDEKYKITDVRGKAQYSDTPSLLFVHGSRGIAYVRQLADSLFKGLGAVKGNVPEIDYTLPESTKEELLKEGLIKG